MGEAKRRKKASVPNAGSKLGKDIHISDAFAKEARRCVDAVTRHDNGTLIVFGVVLCAAIVTGALTDGWLYVGMILYAALAFYYRYTRNVIERERISVERQRIELLDSAQLPLLPSPPCDPSESLPAIDSLATVDRSERGSSNGS